MATNSYNKDNIVCIYVTCKKNAATVYPTYIFHILVLPKTDSQIFCSMLIALGKYSK